MVLEQLVGRRERLLRELGLAADRGHVEQIRQRRLRRELEQVRLDIASRCLPRLTEVIGEAVDLKTRRVTSR